MAQNEIYFMADIQPLGFKTFSVTIMENLLTPLTKHVLVLVDNRHPIKLYVSNETLCISKQIY
jgi:hypothetical protein